MNSQSYHGGIEMIKMKSPKPWLLLPISPTHFDSQSYHGGIETCRLIIEAHLKSPPNRTMVELKLIDKF